jgi:hypothetical protein
LSNPERAMESEGPGEGNGRVLQFRQRAHAPPRDAEWSPVDDLRKYSNAGDDDFRHRMMTNGIAVAVIVVLVGCGIWLIDTMVQMRKKQDCLLSGRRNCAPITVPVDAR